MVPGKNVVLLRGDDLASYILEVTLSGNNGISTIASSFQKMQEIFDRGFSDFKEVTLGISDILGKDSSTTANAIARLVKTASSSHYQRRIGISTTELQELLLNVASKPLNDDGYKTLNRIVAALGPFALKRVFESSYVADSFISEQNNQFATRIFNTSNFKAGYAQLLYERNQQNALMYQAPEEPYLKIFLEDLGKLLLLQFDASRYEAVEARFKRETNIDITNPESKLEELEYETYGISHNFLGAMLLEKLELPARFSEHAIYQNATYLPNLMDDDVIMQSSVGLGQVANYIMVQAEGKLLKELQPKLKRKMWYMNLLKIKSVADFDKLCFNTVDQTEIDELRKYGL